MTFGERFRKLALGAGLWGAVAGTAAETGCAASQSDLRGKNTGGKVEPRLRISLEPEIETEISEPIDEEERAQRLEMVKQEIAELQDLIEILEDRLAVRPDDDKLKEMLKEKRRKLGKLKLLHVKYGGGVVVDIL